MNRFYIVCFIVLACGLMSGCPHSTNDKAATSSNRPEGPSSEPEAVATPPLQPLTDLSPRQLLEKTAAAYKAAFSYSDHGTVRIVAKMLDPGAEPEPWPCTVAFLRPGKLRLEVGEGKFVSDGDDCFAQIRPFPSQVLRFPTPGKWTLETIFNDVYLDQAMELGLPETILRFPPQLILLFAEDPVKTLLPEGAQAEFREPQRIGDISCDLIRITDSEGCRLLWISRDNQALLRFDYFVEGAPVPEGIDSLRMIRIEMVDARLNWDIASEAFQMQQPQDAEQVTRFRPGETVLLGRTLESPEMPTLRTYPEGEPMRTESVADWKGKTVVLCFWTSGSEASHQALAELQKSRERFREDDRVRFIPVNSDEFVANDSPESAESVRRIRETLEAWQLSLPAVQEIEARLSQKLLVDTSPCLVVLGPGGTTEFYYRGMMAEAGLSETIRAVLGGEKPYEKGLASFERQREEHRALLRSMTEKDYYALSPPASAVRQDRKPGAAHPPSFFGLEQRWSLPLTGACRIAVLPAAAPGDSDRILVPCEGNLLAVIDLSGKILSKSKPDGLLNDELLTVVRTAASEGRHYIGVSSISGRAVRIYDEHLKPILSWSPDEGGASTSPKQVISDFRFADVRGDGVLSLLLGVVALDENTGEGDSLRVVDLQGREIWRDRAIVSPFELNACFFDGLRCVLALSVEEQRGTLLKFDSEGKRIGRVDPGAGRQVLSFGCGVQDENGRPVLCMATSDPDGNRIRVEVMADDSRILWSRPLPPDGSWKSIEHLAVGNVIGNGEWLVQGSDGTVFLCDPSKKRLDMFSFGKFLTGLVVLQSGEKHLLVVSDADGVTAWEVVDKESD